MDDIIAYILRLGSEDAESRLFARRWMYIGVKRGWEPGTKVLFERKSEGFTGSAVVARIQLLAELGEAERELCLQKNWYAKLLFGTLARFHPPVPLKSTPIAAKDPLALHGAETSQETIGAIEDLAKFRIIM